jgi:hypothetical protein
MSMTYRQLRDLLNNCDEQSLNQNVTIYVSGDDEFHPVRGYECADPEVTDVLDAGHLFLITRDDSMYDDDEQGLDYMEDRFADGEALASAGFGTDEDYGHFGGDEY